MPSGQPITPGTETYLRLQEFGSLLHVPMSTVYHWSWKGLLVTVGTHGSRRVALNASLKRMEERRLETLQKYREKRGWLKAGQRTLLRNQQPATRLRDGSDDGPTG